MATMTMQNPTSAAQLNIAMYRYLGMIASFLSAIFDVNISIPQQILPIGISFFTFQILSYVFDVYYKEHKNPRAF